MSVSRSIRFQPVISFCSSIPVVVFNTLRIFMCMLSTNLCFIIGFICDLFVSRNEDLRASFLTHSSKAALSLWYFCQLLCSV